MSRHTPPRLPSYSPIRAPYGGGFQYRRKCSKCRTQKPMIGGATFAGGKGWYCKDCRP